MEVKLKKNDMSFEQFVLNQDIRHCTINATDNYGRKDGIFLYKLTTVNGTEIVYYRKFYYGEPLMRTEDKHDFLMSINYEKKVIIFKYIYNVNLGADIFSNYGYQVYELDIYTKEITNKFKSKIKEFLDSNFDEYMKSDEYKNVYENTLTDVRSVETDYLYRGTTEYTVDLRYSLTFDDLLEISIYPEYINSMVSEYIDSRDGSRTIVGHAAIKAKNEIIERLKVKPTERVILASKIRDAVKEAGKTLNITIGNDTIKADNSILFSDEFRSTVGYKRVHFNEIDKITFGRKVLYEAV